MSTSSNLLATVLSVLVISTDASITCRDQENREVDWFMVYKLPKLEGDKNGNVVRGVGFLYLDANSQQKEWTLSEVGIDSKRQMVAYTLQQVYDQMRNSIYSLMYNDAPGVTKDRVDGYRGHTKGVQAFDSSSGFWLIHSVPRFPSNISYDYPDSGEVFGQSMFCISFSTKETLDKLGHQMTFYQPNIYHSTLPLKFAQEYPYLKQLIALKTIRKAPFQRVDQFQSKHGTMELTNFAKYRKFDKDLYADLVAPTLKTSIYTETWMNGPRDLPSICNQKYQVHNIKAVKPDGYDFESSKDHSKWVVSADSESPWVCIGGINGQRSQYDRAGGTMCVRMERAWRLFRNAVAHVEDCHPTKTETKDGQPTGGGISTIAQMTVIMVLVGLLVGCVPLL